MRSGTNGARCLTLLCLVALGPLPVAAQPAPAGPALPAAAEAGPAAGGASVPSAAPAPPPSSSAAPPPAAATPSTTATGPAPQPVGRVVIDVLGFRNQKGEARVLLFAGSKGFPKERERALRRAVVPVQGASVQVVFTDLPPGDYAVSVIHDEDRDGRVRTNFLGMPVEGIGTSRNPKTFGPPGFDDARVRLGAGELRLEVRLRYL